MIALVLAACLDPEASRSTAPDPDPTSAPTEVPDPRAAYRPLAEAPDLDPDPDIVRVALRAAPARVDLGGETVDAWAYEGSVPGPTIRVKRGDRLIVDFTNDLPAETTIHWHGLKVPYAMDGVTWAAAPVVPGAGFTYDFPLDQPGTFWYHPHFDSDGQVDRGLYGLVIVEDPSEPRADVELAWVFDVWGEWSDDPNAQHGFAPLPGPWRVNGVVDPEVPVPGGSTVRIRALNASNAGYLQLDWPGLVQIAADQGLFAAADTLPALLAPGDRAEFELTPGDRALHVETAAWSMAGPSALTGPIRALTVTPDPPAPPAGGLPWPFSGAGPSADPGATEIVYVFTGDVHTGIWLINGEAYPELTIETLALGTEAVVEVRNLSPSEHPFHLHGLTFEVLSIDGIPPVHARIEDTINVAIRQTVRLLVAADNPGEWMAHCHLLPHAEDGMMAVLRVE